MDFEELEEVEKVRGGPKKQGSGARKVATKSGQVIGIGPTGCRVLTGENAAQCRPKSGLAVGDFVDVDNATADVAAKAAMVATSYSEVTARRVSNTQTAAVNPLFCAAHGCVPAFSTRETSTPVEQVARRRRRRRWLSRFAAVPP